MISFSKDASTWTEYAASLLPHNLWVMYNIRVILKVTLFSSCLWASFHPPIPLFHWYPQSKEILLNLHMNCWNSPKLMHKIRE
jgi:hypothetical protein